MTITESSAQTTIPHDYSKRAMVFGGRSSQDLAAKIAGKLSLAVGDVTLKTFSDGEIYGPERSRSWHVEPAAYSMVLPG